MAQPAVMIFKLEGTAARRGAGQALVPYDEMLDIIAFLAGRVELWLAVDADEAEFARMDTGRLTEVFDRERIFLMPELAVRPACPAVFEALAKRVGRGADSCLLLSDDQRLAVAAIDSGFPAAVIISPERMRREFILRGLTDIEYTMHTRPQ